MNGNQDQGRAELNKVVFVEIQGEVALQSNLTPRDGIQLASSSFQMASSAVPTGTIILLKGLGSASAKDFMGNKTQR